VDVRAVRYAVTLAEELHFGRAAQRHFITGQAFGQRIKQLEHELGYPVFARTSRRVALTARGEAFVARAREVLEVFAELGEPPPATRDEDAVVVGVLGFGLAGLWRSVRETLQVASPGVRLVHRELDLLSQHRMVQSGEVDAGIVFDLGPVEGLQLDRVYDTARVAVVPAWSSWADRDHLSAADLESARWVPMASPTAEMTAWLGPAAPPGRRSTDAVRRPEAIASVVATTGAVGLHAAPAAAYYPHPDVRYVPAEGPGCQIAVATREGDDRPAVQALRQAVTAALELQRLS
jgi:DNA-binding transcriptional LysR family regulator